MAYEIIGNEPHPTVETVKVPVAFTLAEGFKKYILRKPVERQHYHIAGKRIYPNVVLSSTEPMEIGTKLGSLNASNWHLSGVMPVARSGDHYECVIDWATPLNKTSEA